MKDAKNQLVYNGSIKNKPISTIPNLDKEWYILKANKIIKTIEKWKSL
jgi:hypothetical protein